VEARSVVVRGVGSGIAAVVMREEEEEEKATAGVGGG